MLVAPLIYSAYTTASGRVDKGRGATLRQAEGLGPVRPVKPIKGHAGDTPTRSGAVTGYALRVSLQDPQSFLAAQQADVADDLDADGRGGRRRAAVPTPLAGDEAGPGHGGDGKGPGAARFSLAGPEVQFAHVRGPTGPAYRVAGAITVDTTSLAPPNAPGRTADSPDSVSAPSTVASLTQARRAADTYARAQAAVTPNPSFAGIDQPQRTSLVA